MSLTKEVRPNEIQRPQIQAWRRLEHYAMCNGSLNTDTGYLMIAS